MGKRVDKQKKQKDSQTDAHAEKQIDRQMVKGTRQREKQVYQNKHAHRRTGGETQAQRDKQMKR